MPDIPCPFSSEYGQPIEKIGEPAGIRTLDLLIKSQLLYQLSYRLPRSGTRRV